MNLPDGRPKPFGVHAGAVTASHEIPSRLYLQAPKARSAFEGAEEAHESLPHVLRKRFVIREANIRLVRIFTVTVGIKQHERRVSLAVRRVNHAEIANEGDERSVDF